MAKSRLREPSTYAGLGAILLGLGQIFDINEAPAVAETVTSMAPALITGNWLSALVIALGSAAVFMREKK